MIFNEHKASDFTITPVARNDCFGCWFAGKTPQCHTKEVTPFIKEVFKQHPGNKTGSCVRLVAILNDEVNK